MLWASWSIAGPERPGNGVVLERSTLRGTWLAQSVKCVTLDLGVKSVSPTWCRDHLKVRFTF